jgi:hypothetical protein
LALQYSSIIIGWMLSAIKFNFKFTMDIIPFEKTKKYILQITVFCTKFPNWYGIYNICSCLCGLNWENFICIPYIHDYFLLEQNSIVFKRNVLSWGIVILIELVTDRFWVQNARHDFL